MRITKLNLFLLCTNLIALGGLGVLIALRGPTGPSILLTVGAALMIIAKVGKAYRREDAAPLPAPESGG